MIRTGGRGCAEYGSAFAILTYHRIALASAPPALAGHVAAGIITPPEQFQSHLEELNGCARVISLASALRLARTRRLPKRAVVLTFDDGFSEHTTLVPSLLRRFGFCGTLFITGHSITPELGLRWLEWFYLLSDMHALQSDGPSNPETAIKQRLRGMSFHARTALLEHISAKHGLTIARRTAMQKKLFADIDAVSSSLATGTLTVGGHTVTHPCLSHLDRAEKQHEILTCRHQLERVAPGVRPSFAYPFGTKDTFDAESSDLVQAAGFSSACTSISGYNTAHTPIFELRRFDMCRSDLSDILKGFA